MTSAGPRERADEIARAATTTIDSHPSKAAEIERIARSSMALAHARTALDARRAYHDVVDLPDGGADVDLPDGGADVDLPDGRADVDAVHFSADRLRVYVTVTALGDAEGDYLASMSALFGEARRLHGAVRARDEAAARTCGADIARAERLDDVDLRDNPTLARGRRRLALPVRPRPTAAGDSQRSRPRRGMVLARAADSFLGNQ